MIWGGFQDEFDAAPRGGIILDDKCTHVTLTTSAGITKT